MNFARARQSEKYKSGFLKRRLKTERAHAREI